MMIVERLKEAIFLIRIISLSSISTTLCILGAFFIIPAACIRHWLIQNNWSPTMELCLYPYITIKVGQAECGEK